MEVSKIAHRYAKSLLQLAKENDAAELISSEMSLVAETISENSDLAAVLSSPVINSDKKISILESIFDGKVSTVSVNLMKTLVTNKRESYLESVANSYNAQYLESEGIVTAEIITAVKITPDLRIKAMSLIKKLSDKKVTLVEKIDKDIIGGLIVRIGDRQIDASVKRRLEEFRKELSKNIYTSDN